MTQMTQMMGQSVYKRRVEFAETDMAGQVHFSVFFRYMEEAEHAIWRRAGMRIAAEGRTHQWPRISAQCDFKARLRVDDEFEVRTEMARVTNRTIQWAHTMVRGDTVVAQGTVTAVCVQLQSDGTFKAVQMPGDVLERLKNALL
jgi:YbgC/YbaW family acyl-CoA thioester hydrolase